MRRHQLAMKRLFAALNGTDVHFVEVQTGRSTFVSVKSVIHDDARKVQNSGYLFN